MDRQETSALVHKYRNGSHTAACGDSLFPDGLDGGILENSYHWKNVTCPDCLKKRKCKYEPKQPRLGKRGRKITKSNWKIELDDRIKALEKRVRRLERC